MNNKIKKLKICLSHSKFILAIFLLTLIYYSEAIIFKTYKANANYTYIPDQCLCPNGLPPTCNSNENFICHNYNFFNSKQKVYPLCIDTTTYQARTPDCFITSSSGGSTSSSSGSGSVVDSCCKNCPDGGSPSCPDNYTYWCLNGTPDCCKLTKIGLDCTNDPDPICFYPDVDQGSQPPPLCNSLTSTCPDGSPITCPEDTSFRCINGHPDCCKEDDCTKELDPLCFYTRSCMGIYSQPNSICCSLCPNYTQPVCPPGTEYWCANGKPSCCTPDGSICTADGEPACFSNFKLKCANINNNNSCCKYCPDGSIPTCPDGKQFWCINNNKSCCDNNGENCTEAPGCFSNQQYRCPPGSLLGNSGCCKPCSNRIDRPTCPPGTELYCSHGKLDCCSIINGKILCTPSKSDPYCLPGGSRQCL